MKLNAPEAPPGTEITFESGDGYLGINCPCDGRDPDDWDDVSFDLTGDDGPDEQLCPRCGTRYSVEIEYRWHIRRDGAWIAET